MNKKLGLLAFAPLFLVACGNGNDIDIDQDFGDNPPDVAGSYKMTSTDCPNLLSGSIKVSQDDEDVIIEGSGDDLKMSGKIEDDGDFEVKDEFENSCKGHIDSDGDVEADCELADTDCHAEYKRL